MKYKFAQVVVLHLYKLKNWVIFSDKLNNYRPLLLKKLKFPGIFVVVLFFNTSCCFNFGFPNPHADRELVVIKDFEELSSPMLEEISIVPSEYMYVEVSQQNDCGDIETHKVKPEFHLSADSTSSVIITQSKGDTLQFYGFDIDQDTLKLRATWYEEDITQYFEVSRNFQIIVSFFDD